MRTLQGGPSVHIHEACNRRDFSLNMEGSSIERLVDILSQLRGILLRHSIFSRKSSRGRSQLLFSKLNDVILWRD